MASTAGSIRLQSYSLKLKMTLHSSACTTTQTATATVVYKRKTAAANHMRYSIILIFLSSTQSLNGEIGGWGQPPIHPTCAMGTKEATSTKPKKKLRNKNPNAQLRLPQQPKHGMEKWRQQFCFSPPTENISLLAASANQKSCRNIYSRSVWLCVVVESTHATSTTAVCVHTIACGRERHDTSSS